MSESKHTPGPWTYGYAGGISGPTTPRLEGPCCGGRSVKYGLVTVPGVFARQTLAICPDQDGVEESGESNARLIAAAPDFLEASEALLIAWEKLAEALPQDDRIEELEFNEFMALRSAVAKARGINSWEIGKHLSGVAKAEGRS